MPVSWDMASGPTVVAYKMSGQGSTFVAVEGPKGSNSSNFRVHDAMSRGFSTSGEPPKGSNYRFTASHDTAIRGLSALSLRDSRVEECRTGAVCCVPPESYRSMSPNHDESLPFSLVPSSVCGKPLGLGRPACNAVFVQRNGMLGQATSKESKTDILLSLDVPLRATLDSEKYVNTPNGSHRRDEELPQKISCSSQNTFKIINIPESALRMDGFDLHTISESSFSLESGMQAVSSTSGEASQGSDETEVQSAFKEGGDLSCSVGSSISPRKGLSRFYAGKSCSFSCLRDVVSVKDLGKPESPYAKKRKVTSSSFRLPPLQKGPAAISKKSLQSGRSTLALAVAMSTKEENESQSSRTTLAYQQGVVPSRSYSLSDLQGAAGSLFFIG